MAEAEFRTILRDFIAENCPAELRNVRLRMPPDQTMPWYRALWNAGLIAPGWPSELGGMALTPERHLVYIEEMEAAGTPWLHDSGVRNLGPALIAFGTETQKAEYLPKIAAGEQIWCQGYSEPGAGSDLASLRCAGQIDGTRLTINGQKIWTTSAHHATHCFCLVRTTSDGPKQHGITFVLVDMQTLGITVRPIRNLGGEDDFCEVFFDDVTISTDCILGKRDDGWKVARSLLGFERIWAGSPRRSMKALGELNAVIDAVGLGDDGLWQDRLVQAEFDTLDGQDLYRSFADLVSTEGHVGTEVSTLKIFSTESFQKIAEWTLEAAGQGGVVDVTPTPGKPAPTFTWFESRAPAIFSGANEIHRNILARRVLAETRLVIAAELLAHIDVMLDLTLEHLRTRQQFGQSLGHFQALQHKVVDLYGQALVSRAVLDAAIARAAAGLAPDDLDRAACRARARVNDTAMDMAKGAIQMFGAMGITEESPLAPHIKRVLALVPWLGTSAEMRRHYASIGRVLIQTPSEKDTTA